MRKPRLSRLVREERGGAFTLTLIALAVVSLLVLPMVSFASTSSISVGKRQQRLLDQYSAGAGVEHAMWRLQYDNTFHPLLIPSASYSQTYNSRSTNVTVKMYPTPTPNPNPTPNANGGGLCVDASVTPVQAPPGVQTTFTITSYLNDCGSSTVHMAGFTDLLPVGFTYVNNSASSTGIAFKQGALIGNPTTSMQDGQQLLTWTYSSPYPGISSGVVAHITVQAIATPPEGGGPYYNQFCVNAQPSSLGTICMGGDAPIYIGWPQYDVSSSAGTSTVHVRAEDQNGQYVIRSWQVP